MNDAEAPLHRCLKELRPAMSGVRLVRAIRAIGTANGKSGGRVLAVELLNRDLDKGKDLNEILSEDGSFSISVRPVTDDLFDFFLGCFPGPLVGDGGAWRVGFEGDDVILVEGDGTIIS